ncbi:hypothetical protein HZC00_01410 [Candidatus Kaiserbacteria bacterium]|nr:hypothetical protein [Candidatus Kaiserbacteria bacterium]
MASDKFYIRVMGCAVAAALVLELTTPAQRKPVIKEARQTWDYVVQKPPAYVPTPPLLGYVQQRLNEAREELIRFNNTRRHVTFGPIRPLGYTVGPARNVYRLVPGGVASQPGYSSRRRLCRYPNGQVYPC